MTRNLTNEKKDMIFRENMELHRYRQKDYQKQYR
jgi:hypothetical protein